MSLTVWPFTALVPVDATPVRIADSTRSESGLPFVRDLHTYHAYAESFLLQFPNPSGTTFATFLSTWVDGMGFATTWLYKAPDPEWYRVTAEAAGTASGGGGETFTTVMKHLDTSTLIVYAAGVVQTLTTDYSISGNNTAPTITTTASFDTGAVTFDYDFYLSVRFTEIRRVAQPGTLPGEALVNPGKKLVRVSILEDGPGGSRA